MDVFRKKKGLCSSLTYDGTMELKQMLQNCQSAQLLAILVRVCNMHHLCTVLAESTGRLQKFVNLQYNTLVCLSDGRHDSLTKHLMFKVLFFLQKSFQFIFLFFYEITKIKIKSFECPKSIKTIKKIILGAPDSWSTIRLSHRSSN